jgi:hypothetical protein
VKAKLLIAISDLCRCLYRLSPSSRECVATTDNDGQHRQKVAEPKPRFFVVARQKFESRSVIDSRRDDVIVGFPAGHLS